MDSGHDLESPFEIRDGTVQYLWTWGGRGGDTTRSLDPLVPIVTSQMHSQTVRHAIAASVPQQKRTKTKNQPRRGLVWTIDDSSPVGKNAIDTSLGACCRSRSRDVS